MEQLFDIDLKNKLLFKKEELDREKNFIFF